MCIQPHVKYEILLCTSSIRYYPEKDMAHRYRQFSLALLTIGCLLSPMTAVKAQPNGGPPSEADGTFSYSKLGGDPSYCQFPVRIDVIGKAKKINIPGSRTILTSPQATATVTNITNSKQVNFVVTGAFHLPPPNSDGTQTYVVTGRNLLGDPVAGFVLASGSFRFTIDANGNATEPLNGKGNLTKVCPLIQ